MTDYNEDYRTKEGTDQERFVKLMAVLVQKKQDSLKGLNERVKVKLRNFGGEVNYVSLKYLPGVHKYLKLPGDFMDTYDLITGSFGASMHVLSTGYFVDQKYRRAVLSDDDSELIFVMRPRVEGVLAVLDLATLTDAKLATITQCRGKETGQHASHKASVPQVEYVIGDSEPLTSQKEAVPTLKGGRNDKKQTFLKDMRSKLAKEFTKNPHAFMKDINTTAIKDTWTGTQGHWMSKDSKIVSTQVIVRFSRPFTREDFL